MYQIGLFSKINQVTIKALRYYDDIGLLKPAYIDEHTGYRYYELSQSYDLHRIQFLKNLGLNLKEIQQILQGKSKDELLKQKKAGLLKELADLTNRIAQIEYYLSAEQIYNREYEVLIKEIPEVIVVSKRKTIDSYKDLFHLMPEMGEVMEQLDCVCAIPEYCFSIYHDEGYQRENVDVEICEAVTELQEDQLGVQFKKLDCIPTAACVYHKGPYEELPQAYLHLMQWIEKNDYRLAGLPRESYIDGVWNKESEQEWLTEVQIPIK